jgi:hypothetical protein
MCKFVFYPLWQCQCLLNNIDTNSDNVGSEEIKSVEGESGERRIVNLINKNLILTVKNKVFSLPVRNVGCGYLI